jgi:hypothetical protein
MRHLDTAAAVAGLCALGLALYEAFLKAEYVAAGVCLAVFLGCCVAFWRVRRKAGEPGPSVRQTQRSGAHSTNLQAGGDINIGGGKSGR